MRRRLLLMLLDAKTVWCLMLTIYCTIALFFGWLIASVVFSVLASFHIAFHWIWTFYSVLLFTCFVLRHKEQ